MLQVELYAVEGSEPEKVFKGAITLDAEGWIANLHRELKSYALWATKAKKRIERKVHVRKRSA